ncbi:MAG: TRAM domain-containing protein [Planctomycetota bacterium]
MAEKSSYLAIQEAAERTRLVLLRFVRVGFFVLFSTITLLNILGYDPKNVEGGARTRAFLWPVTLGVSLGLAAIVVGVDVFTPRKKISTLFSIFLGLLGAMLATLAVGAVIDLIWKSWDIQDLGLAAMLKVLIGMALAYLVITTVLQTQDDFRLVIPYVEFAKQVRGPRPLILDTSALIDGRFLDLASTGLVTSTVVIPSFVVEELHDLGDSSDKLKRARGRRGLLMIEKLQATTAVDVSIENLNVPRVATDQMLLELAKSMPGVIVTTDSGLARVAEIQHVEALNINDVASALRPAFLPGQSLRIQLSRAGEHPGQAVGYLDDGTMVVVDEAESSVGQELDVTVTSAIQTNSGRMVFAKAPPQSGAEAPAGTPTEPPQAPGSPAETIDAPAQPTSVVAAPGATADSTSAQAPASGVPRTPFPIKPPRSIRDGSPRNPRR